MRTTKVYLVVRFRQSDRFPYDHIVARHSNPGSDNSVVVQFVVYGVAHPLAGETRRFLELFLLVADLLRLGFLVRAIEHRSEEAPLDGARVQNDTVLLIVSRVTQNRDDAIDARWQFAESQILHGSCGDQRFVRIIKHVSQSVHAHVKVCYVHTHGLFTHSALETTIRSYLWMLN